MMIPSPKPIFETWSALVGIWGSSYLALLEAIDAELAVMSGTLAWPFLIIGTVGSGSVFITSWKESRRATARKVWLERRNLR